MNNYVSGVDNVEKVAIHVVVPRWGCFPQYGVSLGRSEIWHPPLVNIHDAYLGVDDSEHEPRVFVQHEDQSALDVDIGPHIPTIGVFVEFRQSGCKNLKFAMNKQMPPSIVVSLSTCLALVSTNAPDQRTTFGWNRCLGRHPGSRTVEITRQRGRTLSGALRMSKDHPGPTRRATLFTRATPSLDLIVMHFETKNLPLITMHAHGTNWNIGVFNAQLQALHRIYSIDKHENTRHFVGTVYPAPGQSSKEISSNCEHHTCHVKDRSLRSGQEGKTIEPEKCIPKIHQWGRHAMPNGMRVQESSNGRNVSYHYGNGSQVSQQKVHHIISS
jgi:hypothetical protein